MVLPFYRRACSSLLAFPVKPEIRKLYQGVSEIVYDVQY